MNKIYLIKVEEKELDFSQEFLINESTNLNESSINNNETQNLRNNIQKTEKNRSYIDKQQQSSKWKKLKNVVKSVNLFKNPDVQQIRSIEQLQQNMENIQVDTFIKQNSQSIQKQNVSETPSQFINRKVEEEKNQAFSQMKDRKNFFQWICRGSKEDLSYIEKAIERDPKRYLLNQGDQELLLNKPDQLGMFPLYYACKNGHLQVVRRLLELQANPYQEYVVDFFNLFIINYQIKISPNVKENILQVSCRWGYVDICEFLLDKIKWNQQGILKAIKNSSNIQVLQLLKNYQIKNNYYRSKYCCSKQ